MIQVCDMNGQCSVVSDDRAFEGLIVVDDDYDEGISYLNDHSGTLDIEEMQAEINQSFVCSECDPIEVSNNLWDIWSSIGSNQRNLYALKFRRQFGYPLDWLNSPTA